MQLAAIIVSLVLAVVGVALFARAIAQIYRFVRLGQPVPAGTRTDDPAARTITRAREFLGHTRMNRWGIVGFAHWFVAVGFFCLVLTLVQRASASSSRPTGYCRSSATGCRTRCSSSSSA